MKLNMNQFVRVLVTFCILCNQVFAGCDWAQIKKNPDNTFTYPENLHICVGKLVQDNKVKDQQLSDLTKAISLKDLAIKEADGRATLWSDTSSKLEDRLQKVDSLEKKNEWLYFSLGVLTTFAAGYTAAKLVGR